MQNDPNLNKANGENTNQDKPSDGSERDYALDALQRIMQLKSRVVLPYLVPHLIRSPVDIKALASLALVAGDALVRHLSRIIQAVVTHIAEEEDIEAKQQHIFYAEKLIISVYE